MAFVAGENAPGLAAIAAHGIDHLAGFGWRHTRVIAAAPGGRVCCRCRRARREGLLRVPPGAAARSLAVAGGLR